VVAQERILSATIEPEWWQTVTVAQHGFEHRLIFGTASVAAQWFLDELGVLLEMCHRGMTACGAKFFRVCCRQPQGTETTHAESGDKERRAVRDCGHGLANSRRYILDDPLFEILVRMRHVSRAVTPESIAGHRQY